MVFGFGSSKYSPAYDLKKDYLAEKADAILKLLERKDGDKTINQPFPQGYFADTIDLDSSLISEKSLRKAMKSIIDDSKDSKEDEKSYIFSDKRIKTLVLRSEFGATARFLAKNYNAQVIALDFYEPRSAHVPPKPKKTKKKEEDKDKINELREKICNNIEKKFKVAKALLQASGLRANEVILKKSDLNSMKESNAFELIVAPGYFSLLPEKDLKTALEKCAGLLQKNGGYLLIEDIFETPAKENAYFTEDGFVKQLQGCNFDLLSKAEKCEEETVLTKVGEKATEVKRLVARMCQAHEDVKTESNFGTGGSNVVQKEHKGDANIDDREDI